MNTIDSTKTFAARYMTGIFTTIFCFLFILSRIYGLMNNQLCFAYLGCNIGFFGYDGLLHLTSGIAVASAIVWIMRSKKPESTFHRSFWANVFLILAFAALIAVAWEMLEYAYDYVRLVLLHINLLNPNIMSQPTNGDTMGDITLSLIGALVTAVSIW